MIAARRQPALVIVHTKELLNQWIDRIETFLGIPRSEIGVIGAGKKTIGERITVGIVNSVYSSAGEIREHIGHLIVDECHRTPSRTFTEAVSAFDCRYMLGLSAGGSVSFSLTAENTRFVSSRRSAPAVSGRRC